MQDAVKKIKDLRDKAKDESLPQDVRNKFLDKANAIELGTYKPTMAKGGAVAMPSQAKLPSQAKVPMAKGGAVKKAKGKK